MHFSSCPPPPLLPLLIPLRQDLAAYSLYDVDIETRVCLGAVKRDCFFCVCVHACCIINPYQLVLTSFNNSQTALVYLLIPVCARVFSRFGQMSCSPWPQTYFPRMHRGTPSSSKRKKPCVFLNIWKL